MREIRSGLWTGSRRYVMTLAGTASSAEFVGANTVTVLPLLNSVLLRPNAKKKSIGGKVACAHVTRS